MQHLVAFAGDGPFFQLAGRNVKHRLRHIKGLAVDLVAAMEVVAFGCAAVRVMHRHIMAAHRHRLAAALCRHGVMPARLAHRFIAVALHQRRHALLVELRIHHQL